MTLVIETKPASSPKSSVALFAVGIALLILVIFASLLLVWREQDGDVWVRQTVEAETQLTRLALRLQEAESAQRTYLLIGDDSLLAPFVELQPAFGREADSLATAIAGDSRQLQDLATLRELAGRRMGLLEDGIALRRSGGLAAAVTAVHRGNGRTVMAEAQDLIARMIAREQRLLEERQAAVNGTQSWLQGAITLLVLLVLLISVLAVGRARRQAHQIAAAHRELHMVHDSLVQASLRREQLEEQLRQAQKMEAIGQLTGGLAHDFNNMLAVIGGNLQLLRRRLDQGRADVGQLVDSAMDGADRAATLTSRLLAFARRQPLNPVPVDANEFIDGMSDLLRRSLGQEIVLETALAEGLWRTHADPSQLEGALLNLAVNARDAMPEGGRLSIRTANANLDAMGDDVAAGEYVLIEVSDSGSGMPAEVIARAFDPFFTTKDVGKGTGLGLSQVYGFVRQSGGNVKIISTTGQGEATTNPGRPPGTAVKLYLPRYVGADIVATAAPMSGPLQMADGEMLLVVEDEERVRQLAVELLQELGYRVRQAASAAAGLAILDAHRDVTMVLTDVAMPDMNGRRFADEALRRRPDLKVLFMTGYTRDAIVHNGVLDSGVQLLSKPFTLEQLATKVRDVLRPVAREASEASP